MCILAESRMVNSGNVDMFVERGRALWKSIYEPHAEKLYNKLGSYHPDFISALIYTIYFFRRRQTSVALTILNCILRSIPPNLPCRLWTTTIEFGSLVPMTKPRVDH